MSTSTTHARSGFTALAASLLLTACASETLTDSRTPPSIVLDEGQVAFEAVQRAGSPPSLEIGITNGGETPLTGLSASVDYQGQSAGWLSATLDRTSAPAELRLAVVIDGLEPGSHDASVSVSAPEASSRTIAVRLELEAAPAIHLSRESVSFLGSEGLSTPTQHTVEIANSGGSELTGLDRSVSYGSDGATGWLSAELADGKAPTELSLRTDVAGLPPGSYVASVAIHSTLSFVIGQELRVELEIMEDPVRLPDLTLTSALDALTPTEPGGEVTFPSLTVANLGDAVASRFLVGYYLSSDGLRSPDDVLVASRGIGGLDAGAEANFPGQTATIPVETTPGTWSILMIADHDDALEESDESNNQVVGSMDVMEPVPAEFTVSAAASPPEGGSITKSPNLRAYRDGTVLTLTAVPSSGYVFTGWAGDLAGSPDNPATILVDRNWAVEATFERTGAPVLSEILLGNPPADGEAWGLSWTYEWPCLLELRQGCVSRRTGQFVVEHQIDTEWIELFVSDATGASELEWRPTTWGDQRRDGLYRVRAVGDEWAGPYSNTVERRRPAPPIDVTAEKVGTLVTIRWTDVADNEAGFRIRIYDSFDALSPSATLFAGPDQTSISFERSDPGTVFYRLSAFNGDGFGSDHTLRSIDVDGSYGFVRVVNDSDLRILRVRIASIEYIQSWWTGIDRGDQRTFDVTPGVHDYLVQNAHSSDYPVTTAEGTVEVTAGDTTVIRFDGLASLEQILTGGAPSRAWDGDFRDLAGVLQTATYLFRDDGTYTLTIPGFENSSGSYRELSRGDGKISFQAGVREMDLLDGQFIMPGGPPSHPLVQFRPR